MLLSEHLCFDRTNLSQRSLRGGPPPARECLAGRRRPASARAPRASPAAPRRDRAAWGSQQCGTGPCGGAVLSRRVCRGPRPPPPGVVVRGGVTGAAHNKSSCPSTSASLSASRFISGGGGGGLGFGTHVGSMPATEWASSSVVAASGSRHTWGGVRGRLRAGQGQGIALGPHVLGGARASERLWALRSAGGGCRLAFWPRVLGRRFQHGRSPIGCLP